MSQEQLQRKKSSKAFKNGFIGGLLGGAVAVAGGVGIMAVTNPANQATTPATQASQTQVEPTKTSTASQGATDITKVVAEVKNAVVSVINKQSTSRNSLSGTQQSSGELATASEGSGVIYKNADGYAYIVTNYHVIANSQELEVLLADGTRAKAEIVGSDQWTDLAVIRIANTNVTTVAEFANSDDVQVGQTAIAIGSPLGSNARNRLSN